MTIKLRNLQKKIACTECIIDSGLQQLPKTMYFKCDEKFDHHVNSSYAPFLIATIPLAMVLGRNIEIEGTIDSHLYENVLEAIALINSWYPNKYKIIKISHRGLITNNFDSVDKLTASFYSGGVDSLFNIAGRMAEGLSPVDLCVLVRGMDISISNDKLWAETSSRLRENVLQLSNLNVVAVETNARDFQNGFVGWTEAGFGPLLGAVSNFLSKGVGTFVIGSTGIDDNFKHASGPLIDRLWSSSSLKIIYYSLRFSRLNKLEIIKEKTPLLLKSLRVCWRNTNNQYNCGICEKCLRTKAELHIINAQVLCHSFGNYELKEDLKHLKDKILDDRYTLQFWNNISNNLNDEELKGIIKKSVINMRLKSHINKKSRKLNI